MADDFEAMWGQLAPVGRGESGGYRRGGFDAYESECVAWFASQARSRGLRLVADEFGNQLAWWEPMGAVGRAVLTGSHLDSVIDGGAFDGPLGVVSALAAVDELRQTGFTPARPIGVVVFREEEGSRFGMPCLGSRLATGVLPAQRAMALTDRDGVRLTEAIGTLTDAEPPGRQAWLDSVGTFVELHIEQGRHLDTLPHDAPVGVASRIWPHARIRCTFTGAADHAGATRMEDRHDPMLTYAMTALAANKQARQLGARATFGRVEATPNSTNSISSSVTAWLDVRAADPATLTELVEAVQRQSADRAVRDGTSVEFVGESNSAATEFDEPLRDRLAAALGGAPVLPTAAGHDAGILSEAGIETTMLFVRNPTGVSHSPAETTDLDTCLAGVVALATTLRELAG